jgi:hypothetical protein
MQPYAPNAPSKAEVLISDLRLRPDGLSKAAADEIERLRAQEYKLARRIHQQRYALRENWQIVEQRRKWLGTQEPRQRYHLAGLQHGSLKMVYARHERDKRLFYCTLKYVDQPASIETIREKVGEVFAENSDKAAQAKERPALIGWFVGQTMKLLHGAADPEIVCFECSQTLSSL